MFKLTKLNGYTKILIEGKIKHSDYVDTLIPKINELAQDDLIKMMIIIRDLSGIELRAIVDEIKFELQHKKDFKRIAIVTNDKLN